MIGRLNFFDLYGYLVPGSVFVLIACLPYALLEPKVLSIEVGSGLIAIVVAYVVGYQLYGLAELTLLSRMRIDGEWRHYSEFILYDHDPTHSFPAKYRETLRGAIQTFFKVTADEHYQFLPARAVLLQRKLAIYVEQYQGMYAMARGVSLACGLGCCYLLGWLVVGLRPNWRPLVLEAQLATVFAGLALDGAAVLMLLKRRTDQIPAWVVRCLRLGSNKPDASRRKMMEGRAAWLVVGALGGFLLVAPFWRAGSLGHVHASVGLVVGLFACALTTLRCYAAFQHFALLFAKTVYSDFYVMLRDAGLEKSAATRWIP